MVRIEIWDERTREGRIFDIDDASLQKGMAIFLKYMRLRIEAATGKKVHLTGGSYRGYDIKVDLGGKVPRVDVYTPMRIYGLESPRVEEALRYAIRCIRAGKIIK